MILRQNILLALGIKGIFLGLAIFANATMWMAVFANMGANLIVVGNGLRLLQVDRSDTGKQRDRNSTRTSNRNREVAI